MKWHEDTDRRRCQSRTVSMSTFSSMYGGVETYVALFPSVGTGENNRPNTYACSCGRKHPQVRCNAGMVI
jgi:hypothetical protein